MRLTFFIIQLNKGVTTNKLIMNNIKSQFYNNLNILEQAQNHQNPLEFLELNKRNFESLNDVLTQSNEKYGITSIDYYKYYNLLHTFFAEKNKPLEPKSKVVTTDQTVEESFDNRNKSSYIRDGKEIIVDGKTIQKITSYKFDILVKDKPTFSGELSRTEMELIYRLYSSEGGNVTIKSLAREFPQYTQQQIKKILIAFSITKSCSPLAPHQIEEMSIDEAVGFSVRMKENSIIKKVEEERIRYNEQRVKELTKEVLNLKDKQHQLKNILGEINYPNNPIKFNFKSKSRTLIISLSDIHVGAAVSNDSIYYNEWNEEELNNRMEFIIKSLSKFVDEIDNIVVFNLGDSLDGYKGETTRGGHLLPQNMNDKEQVKVFIRQMLQFFDNLYETFEVPMSYYCVGESNHDGDYGWLANEKLASMLELKYPDMPVEIFDKYMDFIDVNGTMFILSHGKDNKDMFRNLPLVLDVNTESKINEFIDYYGLQSVCDNIIFVKGDLHQSALTHGKKFSYWSVGSIFGASEWIHKNMGNSKAFCDYAILHNDGTFMNSRIKLN